MKPEGPRIRLTRWAPDAVLDQAWTSPVVDTGPPLDRLVPSWHATTPPGSWLDVFVRGRDEGRWSGWLLLGQWSSRDDDVRPTTIDCGRDGAAYVEVEELRLDAGHTWDRWQLQVRGSGSATPSLHAVAAVVSSGTHRHRATSSASGGDLALAVPPMSQYRHRGRYPEYGAGGEAWCSPTSVTMVAAYWGRSPDPVDTAWVTDGLGDPEVPHAARRCYDAGYGGAGNWAFAAAYAGSLGLDAVVTRLVDLREVEQLVAAGIPVIASVRFAAKQLDGAGYSTDGHLLVVSGFTAAGDVRCHDPASHSRASDADVPVTYPRAQLERAWLEGSGGLVYVLRPPDVPLPPNGPEPHW